MPRCLRVRALTSGLSITLDDEHVARANQRILGRVAKRIRTSTTSFKIDTTPRLLVLAAIVGLGAGLGAVVLIEAVDFVTELARDVMGGEERSAWIFLLLPGGLWLAWFITYWLAPEAAGHGIPQIIGSIVARSGRIRLRIAPLKTVATALTLGVGGSAGREGPIAHIGAAIGSRLGRRFNLNESMVRSLIGAGAAAGISATFNAPIAGMLFAMEVVLGSFSGAHMSAIVVAWSSVRSCHEASLVRSWPSTSRRIRSPLLGSWYSTHCWA